MIYYVFKSALTHHIPGYDSCECFAFVNAIRRVQGVQLLDNLDNRMWRVPNIGVEIVAMALAALAVPYLLCVAM